MEYIFAETFVAHTPDASGRTRKLFIAVSSATPDGKGGFQCALLARAELGTWISEGTTVAICGATTQRAIGQAMLSVDSIVESHLHSHGEWTVESVGLNYDVKLHSAVPQENFERLLASRASNRQVVENFPVLRSELTGLAALKEQQLIRDGVPPDSTSTHL